MKWSGTLAGIAGALAFGTVLACDDSPAAPEAEADQTDGVRFGRTSVNGVAPPYPCGVIDANGVVRLTLDWQAIVTPGGQATVTCHYSDKTAYQLPARG